MGFSATYAKQAGAPLCVGVYTQSQGEIRISLRSVPVWICSDIPRRGPQLASVRKGMTIIG